MPQRLVEQQLAYYAATREMWSIRSRCAAGIQLQVRTDSPWLELGFEGLGGARRYLGIDCEADGQCVASVRLEDFAGSFSQRLLDFGDLPPATRTLVVHLPCSLIVRLQRVEIADGATVEAVLPPSRRLLCLGDSITQGMHSVSPLSTYTTQLARLLDMELINQGIGGHRFDPDSLAAISGPAPALITVAYGTNDWRSGMDRDAIRKTATDYVTKLQQLYPDVPVVVVSPLWRSNCLERSASGLNLAEFSEAILEAASKIPGVRTVDGRTLVPHQELYFADGLHPVELGFMHYAANLYREISRFVR
jgi:lysophospholipase L1-like esterase